MRPSQFGVIDVRTLFIRRRRAEFGIAAQLSSFKIFFSLEIPICSKKTLEEDSHCHSDETDVGERCTRNGVCQIPRGRLHILGSDGREDDGEDDPEDDLANLERRQDEQDEFDHLVVDLRANHRDVRDGDEEQDIQPGGAPECLVRIC